MDYKAELQTWLDNVTDQTLRAELESMAAGDDVAAEDAFFQELTFGTAGLRGVMGAGPNRMNTHTVGKATQGLANHLNANAREGARPSVAIGRDSRLMGEQFVRCTAEVLAANGIRAFLFPRVEPTPVLAFAVRHLGASAGICITASHNPKIYNGYKVYNADGCQINTRVSKEIQAAIGEIDTFSGVKRMPFEEAEAAGLITWIDDSCMDAFLDEIPRVLPDDPLADVRSVSVVYSPLNGTGMESMRHVFEHFGMDQVHLVAEQVGPDGEFPTCPSPNPEERGALELGIRLCEQVNADLMLATDPDADRVGLAVRHGDDYVMTTGNEVGLLLIDYLCTCLPAERVERSVVMSTIVSSHMIDALAEHYGFELRRPLSGFKFQGEQVGLLEQRGELDRFLFGYEDAYGYLPGTYMRDKCAIGTSALILQMVAHHKAQGRDLIDALDDLHERFGHYLNGTKSVRFEGAQGSRDMNKILTSLRNNAPTSIGRLKVVAAKDYAQGAPMAITPGRAGIPVEPQTLPPSNVLEFVLEDGSKVMLRPSGTEPKIKTYTFVRDETHEAAEAKLKALDAAVADLMDSLLHR